ncbi:MAG: helix-turn-helix domain-containing protein [Dehalococcoidia bacterium]|nr:helix-turn-helix domain-containing protein [Dehalococcoidia bacterium]
MARQGWTVGEAARALGISEKTVRRHIKSGQLKAWMEDGQWLIERAGKERTEGGHRVDSEEEVGRQRVDNDQTTGRQRVDTEERAARQASSADRSTLHATIGLLRQQLEEKDRQIGELHVLLREAQGQIQKLLPMPSRRRWWNPGTWFR